ncbi:MAG: DegQ family serine endoprotease [Pseudomonadales bacterium]|jgi:serine protease Do|nr:DegQ family serine endoprotease [Pseudomonadales bacterium]
MIRAVHDRITQFALAACLLLAAQGVAAAARALPDFTELVEEQSAAVVNISTVYRAGGRMQGLPPGMDPEDLPEFFRYFFRGMPEGGQQRERRSLGSGFILSGDGYILTNNHVVEDADEIFVRLVDRREFEAEVVGTDPRSDLALLKVDADDLPTVRIGRSSELDVGEWVLAIGSPFGFDYSVTAGIVSAKERSLPNENNENYVPFIQTDVAINPGNSGGPLFDLDGRVVGINSQIYTRSGGFMGLSFAIPIDVAMEVAEQLKETGSVSRGWLGVMIQDVNRDLAESFGLDKPAGALVAQVVPDSPAANAGIEPGDIIVEFDGEEIDRSGDLPHVVGRIRAGSEVEAIVVRDGDRERIEVRVGELAEGGPQVAGAGPQRSTGNVLGLAVRELPAAARERLDVDGGVQVERVGEGSPAASAGLRPGDVITRLNNVAIDSVATFGGVVEELPRGRSIPVLVIRGGVATFIPLRIPDED